MALRAWRIAFVSSQIKWLLLGAGVLGALSAWLDRTNGVTYWPLATATIAFNVQVLLSLACLSFAAWQARNDRQPAIAELSGTFPSSAAQQLIIRWSVIAVWGIVAYATAVAVSMGVIAADAHWGFPDWRVLTQGATVVILASTVGYGLGRALPTYILIPVWVVGWFTLDGILALRDSAIKWAAPRSSFQNVDRSIFRENVPVDLDLKQAAWFVALSAFVIGLCILSAEQRRRAAGLMFVAATVALTLASIVLFRTPADVDYGSGDFRDFRPVCESNEVVNVCLHPAERPLLDETASLLALSLEPVSGLDGVPVDFVDSAVESRDANQAGIYVFSEEFLDHHIAEAIVSALFPSTGSRGMVLTREQAVLATWLYAQAGYPYDAAPYWTFTGGNGATLITQSVVVAEAQAFDRLPEEVQHEWLERHWSAIRAGTIESVDFP